MKYKILALSISLSSLLFSCSDDLSIDMPDNSWAKENHENEVAYFRIGLNLIDSDNTATRAQYADGIDTESEIYNFRVYVFKSSTRITTEAQQSAAQYMGYAEFSQHANMTAGSSNDIDKTGTFLVKADKKLISTLKDAATSTSAYFYGAVLANYEEDCYEAIDASLTGTGNDKFASLYNFKATTRTNYSTKNEPDFLNGVESSIPMSSAAYWQGENGPTFSDPLLLREMNLNNIEWMMGDDLDKLSQLDKDPVGIFYLQRNVAKFTINRESVKEYLQPAGSVNEGIIFKISGGPFDLNGLNHWSYLFQNTTGFPTIMKEVYDEYQAKGSNGATEISRFHLKGQSGFDHVNWGIDVNYDENYNSYPFVYYEDTGLPNYFVYEKYITYGSLCFENTGGIETMKYNQTTGIRIGCQVILPENECITIGTSTYNTWIAFPNDPKIYSKKRFLDQVKTKYNNVTDITFNTTGVFGGIYTGDKYTFENINTISTSGGPAVTKADIASCFNKKVTDYFYNGSTHTVYYYIPIRHFSDQEMNGLQPNYDDNGNVSYDKRHLGRWGMVRNNWYELTINSITGRPMTNTREELDLKNNDSWDDPNADMPAMNYTFNVLKWNKHDSQEVAF
ncbi:MAG: fimbria major subunit [Muribaculaceae bacterium]|nr:fimbria major subunit [Muribaculaceae bacterium]